MQYTCFIDKRDYSEWHYEPPNPFLISPLEYKLFHKDIFLFKVADNSIELLYSPTRQNKNIPGILLLQNNRTFGRTQNKKRLYYQCRPNDKEMPTFLVPFDMLMGFDKNFKNKYVTFSFEAWKDKHPQGILSQNLGDVHDLSSFYEYQLYCKQLHIPITPLIERTKKAIKQYTSNEWIQHIMDRPEQFGPIAPICEEEYVFTMDPSDCVTRDDAISIRLVRTNEYSVKVYIANVWIWLEAFDAWKEMGSRVSTIYLPDKKRAMLPTLLEQQCSLDENTTKLAWVMEFTVVNEEQNWQIRSATEIRQCHVFVSKNYAYSDGDLKKNEHFQYLFALTKEFNLHPSSSFESTDIVLFWMTQMNGCGAKHMRERGFGIFRTVISKNLISFSEYPKSSFLHMWEQQISGSYVSYKADETLEHTLLGVSEYIHLTSPIRRLVDLLNQVAWVAFVLQPLSLRDEVRQFYQRYTSPIEMETINRQMKNIRKVQNDCDILHKVVKEPNLLKSRFLGTVLSSSEKNPGAEICLYKCTVYIESLKWITEMTIDKYAHNSESIECQLFLFEKEETMRRKIRAQRVILDT